MKDKRKKEVYSILLVLIIVGISLGYAALSATLNINGSSRVKNNTWDIHFANVVINPESVELSDDDEAASVNPSNTSEVAYTVTLKKPGDFYEFTVDAVNAGTIDGMVSGITSKLNGTVIDDLHPLPVYLDYQLAYPPGDEIEDNQLIKAGQSVTYKVRLEFKKDIDETDLPATDITPSFSFTAGFIQADDNGVEVAYSLYNTIEKLSQTSTFVKTYTGNHQDSFVTPASKAIYYYYKTKVYNNIIFGDFCWQIIRTTDTGGIKLIYNGIPSNGKCNNHGSAIGSSSFNPASDSPAYVGYMYNPNMVYSISSPCSITKGDTLYARNVSYENGLYTLVDPFLIDNNASVIRYYTCGNATGVCDSVTYYTFVSGTYPYYCTVFSNGKTREEALDDMINRDNTNLVDSTIKNYIDTWYQDNLIGYSSYLEDTIFCNDRSVSEYGTWNGESSGQLQFKNKVYSVIKDLSCSRELDQFSVANNKAKLSYPIGLMTAPEMNLMADSSSALSPDDQYWLLSPSVFNYASQVMYVSSSGYVNPGPTTIGYNGVRPVVSLKPGTKYSSGDGSRNNPYVIVTE